MTGIAERIKHIFVRWMGFDEAKIVTEASFDDLGLDSLDEIELALHLEGEFGVDIPDDVAMGLKTVGDTVRLIEKLTANDKTKETE